MINDLSCDIHNDRNSNNYLCIMGDFNEELGHDPALMASICSTHGLYDVLSAMYPSDTNIPTYIRGNKRLDYFLLSYNSPTVFKIG